MQLLARNAGVPEGIRDRAPRARSNDEEHVGRLWAWLPPLRTISPPSAVQCDVGVIKVCHSGCETSPRCFAGSTSPPAFPESGRSVRTAFGRFATAGPGGRDRPQRIYTSVCSAISSASSTSIPSAGCEAASRTICRRQNGQCRPTGSSACSPCPGSSARARTCPGPGCLPCRSHRAGSVSRRRR
jgi:hypothetical protein